MWKIFFKFRPFEILVLYNKLVRFPSNAVILSYDLKLSIHIFHSSFWNLLLSFWSKYWLCEVHFDICQWCGYLAQKNIKIWSSKLIIYVKNHSNHDDFFSSTLWQVTITGTKKIPQSWFGEKMNQAPSGVKCHNHNFVIHNEVRQTKWLLGSRVISECLLNILNTLNFIQFLVKWSKRKDMDIIFYISLHLL